VIKVEPGIIFSIDLKINKIGRVKKWFLHSKERMVKRDKIKCSPSSHVWN
jgi:hypothetical protein